MVYIERHTMPGHGQGEPAVLLGLEGTRVGGHEEAEIIDGTPWPWGGRWGGAGIYFEQGRWKGYPLPPYTS